MGDTSARSVDLDAVHASLPQGLAVVAADGTFLEANEHVLTMLGRARDEVVGRSILDFIHPDDLEFAAAVVSEGRDFGGMITGPIQLRYVDAAGEAHTTDLWSRTCLDDPTIEGYVVLLAEESSPEMLARAVRAIAAAAPVDEVLGHIVDAMAGHPVRARATILVESGESVVPVGRWPLGSGTVGHRRAGDTPWQIALREGVPVDVEIDDAAHEGTPRWAVDAATAGFGAVWCRPICTRDGQVTAVLVSWRERAGRPSANQRRHLDDAVGIAALAFDQAVYRRAMERAAYVDPVSGLANRARFEQLLENDGDGPVDGVLYVDLDGFKSINDRLGHAVGDQILSHVASRLRGAVRSHDEVARVGGDEFVVMCRPPGESAGIEALAERIVRVLGEPYSLDGGGSAEIGASVGVVVGEPDRPLRERVRMADEAMYGAKGAGRRGWRRFESVPEVASGVR